MAVAVTVGNQGPYQFQRLFDVLPFKATGVDFASASDAATVAVELTVPGAALGDIVLASLGVDVADLSLDVRVTAANKVTATVNNNAGSAVDLASTTVLGVLLKPKDVHDAL